MASSNRRHDEKAAEATASPPNTYPRDPESGGSLLSLDKDVAVGLVGEHAQEIDKEVETRVLRKIDRFLIPAMVVGKFVLFIPSVTIPWLRFPGYGLVYYDKAI